MSLTMGDAVRKLFADDEGLSRCCEEFIKCAAEMDAKEIKKHLVIAELKSLVEIVERKPTAGARPQEVVERLRRVAFFTAEIGLLEAKLDSIWERFVDAFILALNGPNAQRFGYGLRVIGPQMPAKALARLLAESEPARQYLSN